MSRKNISISDPVEQRAKEVMKARGIVGLSSLMDVLIREEFERRQAPVIYPQHPATRAQFNEASSPPGRGDVAATEAAARGKRKPASHEPQLFIQFAIFHRLFGYWFP